MICEYCQGEFTPKGAYKQKYCSPRCKNNAGAKLRAERNATLTERRCCRCKQVKPIEDFPGRTHTYCRSCYNAYQRDYNANLSLEERQAKRRRSYKTERTRVDPVTWNTNRRHYLYGLTDEQFTDLLAKQGGACAICRTTEPGGRGNWHVDHNHTCCPRYSKGGKARTCGQCVRGLLCTRCNVGLGNYRHDPELLIAAAEYLARYQTTIEIVRT